ncbi:putative extracellular serine/threonine protein kinase FAM20C [Apostichopus japonicus]|uniref:Putative extracellular serine/threonine protein kinase FAM20C n=1 Tax=Stichopus japonicus TaxID=307972 RepID=A0A2G8JQQ7_STIJA|nr:putative extracellular serine/threonine protein kinase FAM20C [Apostichopus japonicus]
MYWANNKSQPFWYDPERHTAEIASFHLDRILNYRRVPPCAGRRVSFSKDIINKTNDDGILHTLRKRDGNDCFIGTCPFCDEDHMICSKDDVMELSVCQQIPGKIYDHAHPWSQGIKESKVWKNKNVCPTVLSNHRMNTTRFFLDTMELALFDYLIVNYDRHHIAYLGHVDIKRSFAAIIDNGKGFANPFTDDVTFLAPIYQCCR